MAGHFFIAGMYVASLGMVNTGLATLIGRNVIYLLRDTGPLGLAASTFLISSTLTQVMGSQATAFVIGPVAISAAIHLTPIHKPSLWLRDWLFCSF